MLTVTVDIEDWYHTPSVTGSPFARFRDVDDIFRDWNERYDYLTKPARRVSEILDGLNLHPDFTLGKYDNLCEAVANSEYTKAILQRAWTMRRELENECMLN